jgi:hypothetical protein
MALPWGCIVRLLFFYLVSFSFEALKVIGCHDCVQFIGLAYQGKDIVFGFIIEYIVASGILAPR